MSAQTLLTAGVLLTIPLLPLAAAALIGARMLRGPLEGDAAEPATARIALAAALLPLSFLAGFALIGFAFSGLPGTVHLGNWFTSGNHAVPLSFTLDGLALAFGLLIAFIAAVTVRFATAYLHREAGFHRFFLGLMLFLSGMLFVALSGNAALAFVGWELAGVSSWLLIGYAYERPTATVNAQRAFLTNRVGDAGFVLGIALAFFWVGSLDWATLAAKPADNLLAGLLAAGFVLAALAKSGQIPFAPWVARALEGPTPSSALFYGALLVHMGVYLLLRIEPLLVRSPALMGMIACLGALTALYGYLSGRAQTDIKSALMFATTTQVGLMFLTIGLGGFRIAAAHLILHALWRGWQFLAAPGYMHLIDAQPAPPPPAWLARWRAGYRAALHRFWLEPLTDALLVRPTLNIARDVRAIDENVVSRLVGLPADMRADALMDSTAQTERVVRGHGVAGALLEWVGDHLDRFESRLILQTGGGKLARGLSYLGVLFRAIEGLLERPRYLLMLVMATFVVIL